MSISIENSLSTNELKEIEQNEKQKLDTELGNKYIKTESVLITLEKLNVITGHIAFKSLVMDYELNVITKILGYKIKAIHNRPKSIILIHVEKKLKKREPEINYKIEEDY